MLALPEKPGRNLSHAAAAAAAAAQTQHLLKAGGAAPSEPPPAAGGAALGALQRALNCGRRGQSSLGARYPSNGLDKSPGVRLPGRPAAPPPACGCGAAKPGSQLPGQRPRGPPLHKFLRRRIRRTQRIRRTLRIGRIRRRIVTRRLRCSLRFCCLAFKLDKGAERACGGLHSSMGCLESGLGAKQGQGKKKQGGKRCRRTQLSGRECQQDIGRSLQHMHAVPASARSLHA